MFNLEQFLGKKVAIHCKTRDEAIEFCDLMHELGRKWHDGNAYSATTYWDDYGKNTCYNVNRNTFCDYQFYIAEGYEIIEWSDIMEKKTFTKSDLEAFDFVVKRNGSVEIVNPNLRVLIRANSGFNDLDDIRENLTNIRNSKYDIMKVYRPQTKEQSSYYSCYKGELVFDRERDCPEVKEISLADLEEQYGCKVKIIK